MFHDPAVPNAAAVLGACAIAGDGATGQGYFLIRAIYNCPAFSCGGRIRECAILDCGRTGINAKVRPLLTAIIIKSTSVQSGVSIGYDQRRPISTGTVDERTVGEGG